MANLNKIREQESHNELKLLVSKTLKRLSLQIKDNKELLIQLIKEINENSDKKVGKTEIIELVKEISKDEKEESRRIGEIEKFIVEKGNELRLLGVLGERRINNIKKLVKEQFDEIIDNGEIIEILKRIDGKREKLLEEDEGIGQLNDNVDTIKKYDIEDGHYIFLLKRKDEYGEEIIKRIKLKIETIDNIFHDYSRHGKNLSGDEIIKKYRLKPEVFSLLKNRLGLYKSSNVISPFTLENSEESVVNEKIQDAIDESINDKFKEKFVQTYESTFKKESKKALQRVANRDSILGEIQEAIKGLKPIAVNKRNIDQIEYNSDIGIYCMSDYHFGEDDDEILEKRIDVVIEDMIKTKEKHIHLLSLGDLGENFLEEGMHVGQLQRQKKYGFELVEYLYKLFIKKFIDVINGGKTLEVDWQGGNHDRTGKTHDHDRARTWALVVGEMIKLGMKNYEEQGLFKINNIQGPIIRKKVGQLGIIAAHGDGMFFKLKNSDVLAKYGFGMETYHVILQGDKHHFEVKQDTNSINIVTSSIKSGGDYAENVIFKESVPGYTKIEETKKGKANILLKMFDF